MESGIAPWGASRRLSDASPRLRSWAVRERPRGRPSLRLLAGLGLERPWTGPPRRCAVCGCRSRRLRVLAYRARPWSNAYRRLPAGSLAHYSCATVPDEPLELETPRSWLLRPLPAAPTLLEGGWPPERMNP